MHWKFEIADARYIAGKEKIDSFSAFWLIHPPNIELRRIYVIHETKPDAEWWWLIYFRKFFLFRSILFVFITNFTTDVYASV